MCVIIGGDSHVRSYSGSFPDIVPVFLSPGKKINFISWCAMVRFFYYWCKLIFVCSIKKNKISTGMILGEPDVRYLAYGQWSVPGEENVLSSKVSLDVPTKELQRSVNRFGFFIHVCRFFSLAPSFVIGVGTPNPELLNVSLVYNKLLCEKCHEFGVEFFDPMRAMGLKFDSGVKNEYITNSVFDAERLDWVHLSRNINRVLGDYLKGESYFRPQKNPDCFDGNNGLQYNIDFEVYKL